MAPELWAISDIASILLMPVVGFPGVSICISFVLLFTALFTASISVESTNVT